LHAVALSAQFRTIQVAFKDLLARR
jgi:hypothetical protein